MENPKVTTEEEVLPNPYRPDQPEVQDDGEEE